MSAKSTLRADRPAKTVVKISPVFWLWGADPGSRVVIDPELNRSQTARM